MLCACRGGRLRQTGVEWRKHLRVRQPTAHGYNPVTDGSSGSIIQKVEEESQKRKLDSEIWRSGTNPHGRYVAAQICLFGTDFERGNIVQSAETTASTIVSTAKFAFRVGRFLSLLSFRSRSWLSLPSVAALRSPVGRPLAPPTAREKDESGR